jgi:hypothetical protein
VAGGAALVVAGNSAYKMSEADAQKVQQQTGKPPEDLSEEQLEQAMDDLNIEEQDLTPEDQAAIEAEAEN